MDANVVLFPGQPKRPGMALLDRFKLCAADKIELFRFQSEGGGATVVRIAVHEGSGLCEAESDVALLYAPGGLWARWGLARHAAAILVWRCTDGQDLGQFGSVREALEAIVLSDLSGVAPTRRSA